MSTESPAWVHLIRGCKSRPTLPFIVGALREYAQTLDARGDGFEQVLGLFEEMARYRIAGERSLAVYIERCGQLKVPVFSIVPEERKLYSRACFPSRAPGQTRLCFSTDIERSARARLDEVADTLFHGYDHPDAINLHHYSRDSGEAKWRPFDSEDQKTIIAALGMNDGDSARPL